VLNAVGKCVDLHAVYLESESRVNRFSDSWGVEPQYALSISPARRLDVPRIDFHVELALGMTRKLRALKPDVILLVSWHVTGLGPLLWSRRSGVAAVMWAESTRFSGLLRDPLSTWTRGWITRAFDGYVTNGSQATRYLEDLGAPSSRIVTSLLPAGVLPRVTRRSSRADDDPVRFLFVGRLTPQKRSLELIQAFETVRAAVPNAVLTVVGAGQLATEVREAAARVPGVRYVGHREGAELASFYNESDILVLPALREVWGVVVNEALSHGLFVVATDQVGSAHDLLEDHAGLVLPAADLSRLAPSLIDVARTVDLSDEARTRRAAMVANCTPERFAADIVRAVDIAVHVRARRSRGSRRISPSA
jgi:1,2-diacylglycerol 3-alpha-glucosyltransferase